MVSVARGGGVKEVTIIRREEIDDCGEESKASWPGVVAGEGMQRMHRAKRAPVLRCALSSFERSATRANVLGLSQGLGSHRQPS